MTLFALIKGNTTFKDIYGWMTYNDNNEVLKQIFEKREIKIPSKSTLHSLLTNTDNNALEKVFRDFFFGFTRQKNVAIDGKYTQERHKAILNILDKDIKIVFAHKFLDKNIARRVNPLGKVVR